MESNIEEGNKLIDIFYYGEDKGRHYHGLNYYHKHWNLLMPVVEKIKEWYNNADFDSVFFIENTKMVLFQLYVFADINTVWSAVVEFIKWFNQNSNNGK